MYPTAAGTHIAWGIPFHDASSAKYTRAVMRVASLMSLLALVSVILQFVTGYYFSVGIFAAVVLPLCGYCGAKRRSRFLLSFFTICNCIISTLFVISFIMTVSILGDYVSCACSSSCRADHAIPADEAARICDSQGRYRALYWVSMGFAFAMAALQCAGVYYGSKLLRTKDIVSTSIPIAQPVVGTYAVPQQPGSYVPPSSAGPTYASAPYAPPLPGYAPGRGA